MKRRVWRGARAEVESGRGGLTRIFLMTALQIARAHCANWRKDGKGCLGAIIDDDLQIRRCIPRPRCVLGSLGERGLYFEECVAPMAGSIENPRARLDCEAAIRDYRLAAKLPCADERPCPVCGQAMEPGRRYGEVCAASRRKESTRRAVQRHRVGCKQLSPIGALEIKALGSAEVGVGMVTAEIAKTGV